MKEKRKFTIEEKSQIKRETLAVAIGAVLAATLIVSTASCVSCIGRCAHKEDKNDNNVSSYESTETINDNNKLILRF